MGKNPDGKTESDQSENGITGMKPGINLPPPGEIEHWTPRDLRAILSSLTIKSYLTIGSTIAALVVGSVTLSARYGLVPPSEEVRRDLKNFEFLASCSRVSGVYHSSLVEGFRAGPMCAAPAESTLLVHCDANLKLRAFEYSQNSIFSCNRTGFDQDKDCGTAPTDKLICTYGSEWDFAGVLNIQDATGQTLGKVLRRVRLVECGKSLSLPLAEQGSLQKVKESIEAGYKTAKCSLQFRFEGGQSTGLTQTCIYNNVENKPYRNVWHKVLQ